MTKLRWDKAGHYDPDPGAIVEVPDSARPSTSQTERKRQKEKRDERQQGLRERSLEHDRKLAEPGAAAAVLAKKAAREARRYAPKPRRKGL